MVQCIGLILFKLFRDHIDLLYFGSVQGLVSLFSGFDVWSFNRKNVPVATSRFKAVMQALPLSSVPTNIFHFYLDCISKALSVHFRVQSMTLCMLIRRIGAPLPPMLTVLQAFFWPSMSPYVLSTNALVLDGRLAPSRLSLSVPILTAILTACFFLSSH